MRKDCYIIRSRLALVLLVLFNVGITTSFVADAFILPSASSSSRYSSQFLQQQVSCSHNNKKCKNSIQHNHDTTSTSSSSSSALYVKSLNKDPLTFGGRTPSMEDVVVVILPGIITVLAFNLYDETYDAFHKFVDFASSNTWQAVDGGAYLSDLLTPALNGPISTFVSLLFGSLSSMTLSNLLNRQLALSKLFSKLVEDIRLANIHFGYLPEDYGIEAKSILRNYAMELSETFEQEYGSEDMKERRDVRRREIQKLMILLHDLSIDPDAKPNGRILDESYGTVKRIIDGRAEIAATYDSQFPIWHYGNLILLASAICTIFFILTDRPALIFLGAFQLRTAWSLLVCTISVMGCVIYDLNTPLEGVFQVVKESDRQFLREFALESDER